MESGNLEIYSLTTTHSHAFGKTSCAQAVPGWSWGPMLETTTSVDLTVPSQVASLVPRASTPRPWVLCEQIPFCLFHQMTFPVSKILVTFVCTS